MSIVNPITTSLTTLSTGAEFTEIPNNEEVNTPEERTNRCCGFCKFSLKLIPVITVMILSVIALVAGIILANIPIAVTSGLIFMLSAVIFYQIATSGAHVLVSRLKQSQVLANTLNRSLQNNLHESKLQTQSLKQSLTTMRSENGRLSTEVSFLEKNNNQLTQSLQRIGVMLEDSKKNTLHLQENLGDLREEVLNLKLENEQLTASLTALHGVTLKLHEAGTIIGKDANTAQASLDQLKTCLAEIQTMETTSQELRTTSSTLKIDVQAFTTQATNLVENLMTIFSDEFKNSMAQNAAQCRINIRDLTDTQRILEEARRELSNSVNAEREALNQIKEEISQSHSVRASLQIQIQILENLVRQSRSQQNQLQHEIDRLICEVNRLTELSTPSQEHPGSDDRSLNH